MSENIKLALKCGAVLNDGRYCMFLKEGSLAFTQAELDAFAAAIRRKTLQDAHTKLQEAGLGHAAGFYTLERLKAMAQEGVTK